MNESELTRDLLVFLRGQPHTVVLKHADRFTHGIPDISVSSNQGEKRTNWLEIKYIRPKEIMEVMVAGKRMPQLMLMNRLAKDSNAWYFMYFGTPGNRSWEIWEPQALLKRVREYQNSGSTTQGLGGDYYMTGLGTGYEELWSVLKGEK